VASGSRSVVGMRSRASGVARLEIVAASFIFNSRRFVHSSFYWTCHLGRAGAHPYHATQASHL
jgi:hypothetical protein